MDCRTPAFVTLADIGIEGRPSKRLMVALKTIGCRHAHSASGGCTFCGFRNLTAKGRQVSGEDLLVQVDSALKTLARLEPDVNAVSEIDIYNSGSFLDCDEIPEMTARDILQRFSNPSIRKILIESRPEFISRQSLMRLKDAVGDRILEVGMGLETKNDEIRLGILNKGFTLSRFEEAASVMAGAGVHMLAYVLLKPQGLSEGEAVRDVLDTITYLENLGKRLSLTIKIALQPMFVPEHTALEELYRQGQYQPPRLWSVIEILKATRTVSMEIVVALSDEGISGGRTSQNCPRCTEEARRLIASFNITQDRSALDSFTCLCQGEWSVMVNH